MKDLIVLGSTGSIGTQTLTVARKLGIRITGLAAGSNYKLLEEQAREFMPKSVAMFDEDAAKKLKIALSDTDIKVFSGKDGINAVATGDGDIVLCAIVGIAGLESTLKAIEAGKDIALANKETLVTGGRLVKQKIKEKKVKLLRLIANILLFFSLCRVHLRDRLKRYFLRLRADLFLEKHITNLKKLP